MLSDRLVRWLSRHVSSDGKNSNMGMPITIATDIGLVRVDNQDRIAVMRVNTVYATSPAFVVVAVADGMGEMKDGVECAARTLAALFNTLVRVRQKRPAERLTLATEAANVIVNEFSGGNGGATLSALLVTADQGAWTVNVGDSRIYAAVSDSEKEKVVRLTVDDTRAGVGVGPGKGLLQFIGLGEGVIPHIGRVPVNAKRILITSDGMHFVRHEILSGIFLSSVEHKKIAEQLLIFAKLRGAPDNATLAVVDLYELVSLLPAMRKKGIEIWDAFDRLRIM